MKAFITRIAANHSFFWRYFFLLFLLVVMFFVILSASTNQTVRVHQEYLLEQIQGNFLENCDAFSTKLSQTLSLTATIQNSDSYRLINFAKKPFTYAQYFHTGKIRDLFSQQLSLLNTAEEGFIYFKNSDICVTKNTFYETLDAAMEHAYKYDTSSLPSPEQSLKNWIDTVVNKNTLYPFSVCDVTIKNRATAPYLTILVQPTTGRQLYGLLYSTETILNAFNIHTLPENTYLTLTSSGAELFSYNQPDSSSEYITFSSEIPSIGATAVIGIPKSHFEEMNVDARRSAQTLLLLSAFVGLILCVCFSYIGVRPLHSLIRTHALSRTDSKNEIDAIDSFIKKNKQTNEALQNMLLSSVLARTFHGLPIKKSEAETLTRDFPIFQQSLRLAIVREQDPNPEPDIHNFMFDFLLKKLPGETICEHMSMSEVCIILQNELVPFEMLQKILLEMNGQLKDKPQFVAGVSAPFAGVAGISTAVRQAQLCIPAEGARVAGLFTETYVSFNGTSSSLDFDLKRLQQELNCWNEEEVLRLMEDCAGSLAQSPHAQPEEIFYNILYLLRDAAQAGDLSFDAFNRTAYHRDLTPATNIQALIKIARNLFTQKTNLQVSEIQQLSEALVQFVREHYSDPALSLTTLAEEFCVSERFANKAIISVTGTNFSKFLLNTRMQEAARLFQETDESIASVSELCGCPAISTFYRNFKNYYHKTPAEYKEMFSNEKH